MKLRNKQTGEICKAEAREDGIYLYHETTERWYKYDLSLLAEGWEYYEEPKEYWYITYNACVVSAPAESNWEREEEIGNRFETEKEAMKALEKLKAWKRLKNKGFRFSNVDIYDQEITFKWTKDWCSMTNGEQKEAERDLDILFGGDE